MTPATIRQLADVFERIGNLELALLEWSADEGEIEPPDTREVLREITQIRIDLYRLLREAT